ncbi:hypothetical protein MN116_000820 [Schistosoma mekongi]|uniref:F-box domain-containing protein n=1 Tax=Schistosoma mekongi TaxID=38744 RepID=A0AAE2D8V3_SCHME|nr:hypothetical protein MN116_000820 [Schistosoma mekongi]
METLPPNVLENIFLFLPLADQKSASLTCRRLYYTVSRSVFIVKRRYVLREPISKTCFLFCDPDFINGHYSDFIQLGIFRPATLRHWSNWLSNLSFKYSCPNPAELTLLLRNCTRLQSLDLTGCDCLFDKSFYGCVFLSDLTDRNAIRQCIGCCVTKLSLANISSLTNAHVKHLVETFYVVSDIDLSGCLFDFNSADIYCEDNLTFASFLTVINDLKCNNNFKQACGGTLRLNSTSINDTSLFALATTSGLHLCGIYLDNCRELSDNGFMSLIMSDSVLNCLKEVSWGYPGYRVTFLVAEALLERFSYILTYVKLTKWSFQASSRVSSLLLKCLAIEYLDVASCFARPHFLVNSVSSESSRLTNLILSGHSNMSDEDLNIILTNLNGRLKLLDISSCLQLTDISLLAVYIYLPNLETLLAKWCDGFTDSGIQPTYAAGVLHPGLFNMKCLKSVDFSDCRQITGSSFVSNNSGDFVMHELTSLRIGRVGSLHKNVLVLIPYIAPQLRVLDISRSLANDKTIDLLTCKLCNTLRELFITSCDNVTDQSLSSILHNIPFLQILDVSFCPFISPKGVSIFRRSMPYLYYARAIYVGSRLDSTELN